MPYTIAHGPPKTFATHTWVPVAAIPVVPTIILNARTYPTPTYPVVYVRNIGGWRSAPETPDPRAGRTYGIGEITYPNRVLGKTLDYELEARTNSEPDLELMLTNVLRSFGGNQDMEGTMTVAAFDSSITWTFTARVIAVDPDDEYEYIPNRTYQFSQKVAVTLRMADPRFYTGGVAYL